MKCKLLQRPRSFLKQYMSPIAGCLLVATLNSVQAMEGKIAFTSDRDGEGAIYIMDANGGNPSKLTEGSMPAWLPGGARVGFVHLRDIWTIDREGTNRKNITKGRFKESIWSPAWSPDGDKIAYASRVGGIFGIVDVYLMSADGRNPRKLTDDLYHDDRPSWSPDGRKIAFAAYLQPQEDWRKTEIFAIDANGGNRVNLTQNPNARSTHVSWSPDGSRIAYTASPKPLLLHAPYNIHVMDADGKNQAIVTEQGRWVYEMHPTWSPDGKKIAYAKQTPDGFHDIFTINADGSDLRNITQTHRVDEYSPAWSPPPLAVSSSGRLVTKWGEVKQSAKLQRTVK